MGKSIYDMKLHERREHRNYDIMRVPGGWIYERYIIEGSGNHKRDIFTAMVFIPYNDEFHPGAFKKET